MAVKTFTSEILTSSDTNTYLANSGLVYVTNASATTGTSLSVNNCFTSTYSAYRIIVSRASLGGTTGMSLRMRAAGSDQATLYYGIRSGFDYTTGVVSVSNINNGTQWELPLITDTSSAACIIDLYNPQLLLKTQFSAQGSDARTGGLGALASGGMINNGTSFDGFTIFSAQTITSLNLTVYGYRLG